MLFRVLGPIEVDGTGAINYIGARKPRSLLALLLLRANAWVSVAELVDVVWAGQTPPASAERNIGTYIWQLRKMLPLFGEQGQRIESRSGAYRIRVESGELDTDRFESALSAGTEALAAGVPAEAVGHLEGAQGLWRGAPFEGLLTEAHQPEAARLAELHWTTRERLADALIATARLPDAIALCTSLTAEDPLRESVWVRLVVAFRDAGRKADALAAYQRARTALVRELGTEPGPELRELQQRLLSAEAPTSPSPSPEAPEPRKQPEASEEARSSEAPAGYLRTVLEAAAALSGFDRNAAFTNPPAALGWFTAERDSIIAAIADSLAKQDVASAWLFTSAMHEYVESGGEFDDWPQLVARVATAAHAGNDWYGEMIARNILGIAYTRADRVPEARAEFAAALSLAAAHDDRDAEGTVLVNLAELGESAGPGMPSVAS
ncbi:AfsR/SARP family transcriptional regulator [Kribbella catacumbae]|uniref:AfsR/SARP family transcriptional regulator n=1 Tax=Kribbella catacumbae TaxID=460086 RepID=UPI00146EC467|nr:AfsR/SARP family transcriptional regulator [Kribbella catacumbae]